VLNEFRSLPEDLFTNTSRYRYVVPLARRRMSASFDLPIVASNVTGRTELAFGDLGVRWSWIPWIRSSRGVVVGVDTTWSTATNDALGDGRHTLAPFVQMVFLPSPTTVVAARYAQRESLGGDSRRLDISQGTATLYLAWLPAAAMFGGVGTVAERPRPTSSRTATVRSFRRQRRLRRPAGALQSPRHLQLLRGHTRATVGRAGQQDRVRHHEGAGRRGAGARRTV
jgi:hypothetical protein